MAIGRIIPAAHDKNGVAMHSKEAIAVFRAPNRADYFTGEDYAAACARCYTKRVRFDGYIKEKREHVGVYKGKNQ